MDFLIHHEIIHFIAVLPVIFFLWFKYKKKSLIIISLLVTFLIDIDHLVDYFSYTGINLTKNPFSVDFFLLSQKIIVPFHSWEILFISLFLFWQTKKPIFLVIGLTLIPHYLVDQISYNTQPFSYLLIYRLLNNFSMSSFNHFTIPILH